MAIIQNTAKRKLAEGGIALGFGVHHLRTTAAPMIAAAAGHDFLFIDMEHGAASVQEATQLCIAALPTGIPAIVRVCSGALDEATRLLDNGALGIIVPHVDTAKQAQRIADAFHYPPAGTRSWGGPPPIYGYLPPDVAEAQKAVNDEILTVVMIESPEAVENAGEIAAVDGIDVLFIGSFDLTTSLGIAGQMGHRKLIEAYDAVGKACAKHGKVLGMGGINGDEDSERYVGMGSRFITTGSDHGYVVAGAVARATFLRGLPVGEMAVSKKKDGKKKDRTTA
jgi:2-keto-3-deoxy-L-rhamnonate aldolase RhmA